jgi:hypothetical protein
MCSECPWFEVMSASVLVMSDLKDRADFPALRQPDETRPFAARQSIGAKLARLTILFANGKSTVPFVELMLLLGFFVLIFA